MQNLRWKGNQPGDIHVPFAGVGGELKGLITSNMSGDIWVCELDQYQLGYLISQIEVHRGNLDFCYSKPMKMRVGHMLVHKDHVALADKEDAVENGVIQYQLPKQFWKPENQENRVYWNKVFGGAAEYLVRALSKNVA
jgi:hypothetical protein